MIPPNFDVAIVGAGIIGASLAWRLAQSGLRVGVFDAGAWGAQASSAGAGMLVPGSEYRLASAALDFALHSLHLYPRFVAELEDESGAAIDFTRCGSLEIAASEAEIEAQRVAMEVQRRSGMRIEWLDPGALTAAVRGLREGLFGACFYPEEGQVDPRTVMVALGAACVRRGVEVFEQTPVCRIDISGKDALLRLSHGTVTARFAVLAAGAWSTRIPVDVEPALPAAFPVKGHLVGYRLPPGSLPHVLRQGHTYVVQRRSGYTIAGSSEQEAGFDPAIDAGIVAGIAERAHRLAPGILTGPPDDQWMGFRPACAAGEPQMRRVGDSPLWLAYGHYRNGILLAPATAAHLAAAILSASSETD